ncbi:MAG TPA: N-6 DNA methylase [Candidatus Brocadiia bacterium]|nr:N-6 DNA methylase [Candidatus Brocadiia bacterium]
MGRHNKRILTSDGFDRRETGYYSTPEFVAEFIAAEMLRANPGGRTVLDPCVGREELSSPFARKGKIIDGFDIRDWGKHEMARFKQRDFLSYYADWKSQRKPVHPDYDFYVANPPFNCHEVDYIRMNKARLRKVFCDTGVWNMYSMFLYAMIDMAKEGAVIGVITNDSFMTARNHCNLRLKILNECSLLVLALCPTDQFHSQGADVRTCVMILRKGSNKGSGYCGEEWHLRAMNRSASTPDFHRAIIDGKFHTQRMSETVLTDHRDYSELVVECPREIMLLFKGRRLGEVFRCVTGVSTGNDREFLSDTKKPTHMIPFYKNPGSRRFYCKPDAFLRTDYLKLDEEMPNFIVRSKKLITEHGLICSSMGVPFGACLKPAMAVFGVNAGIFGDSEELLWLLGYLNSSLVTYMVRGIMLRTNMITPGYVARIPIIPLRENEKMKLKEIAARCVEKECAASETASAISRIDALMYKALNMSAQSQNIIGRFCSDLLRLT